MARLPAFLSVKTRLDNSRVNTLPPERKHVSAGFSVFREGENPEAIIFLESGELKAEGKRGSFTMQPGEVFGVQSLLEKQALDYSLTATQDSVYLQIDEERLDSAFKALPVWLLASVRKVMLRIRTLTHAIQKPVTKPKKKFLANFLKKRAEICKAKGARPRFESAAELLRECSWLSKVKVQDLEEELKTLERRKMVALENGGVKILQPDLLAAYADYVTALDNGEDFEPFQLNWTERESVICVLNSFENPVREASAWLRELQENDKFATPAEVIMLEKLGILKRVDFGLLEVDYKVAERIAFCIRHELQIRGGSL